MLLQLPRIAIVLCITFLWSSTISFAQAGALSDRLAAYPDWQHRPMALETAGELTYPDWLAGNWQVESPLVEAIAPLAPDIITPGFAAQQAQLHQAVEFPVRFGPLSLPSPQKCQLRSARPKFALPPPISQAAEQNEIVADRAFNGQAIARAYLGDAAIASVTVDPCQRSRQVTHLNPQGKLIATVIAHGQETPEANQFITVELTHQVFRLGAQIYVNDVETTTHYQQHQPGQITANQVTAIYLSPQDPDYFQAGDRPVALYRYLLSMERKSSPRPTDSQRSGD
ncbi:MAG: DUF6816 family protein [Spirulinaceae cyanobacterium]